MTPASRHSRITTQSAISIFDNIILEASGKLLSDFAEDDNVFDTWVKEVNSLRGNISLVDSVMKLLIGSKLTGRTLIWFHLKFEKLTLGVNELKRTMYNQHTNK